MKSYYTENTHTGLKIIFTDSRDEYVGYEDSSDLLAISLVAGFVVFLLLMI